jgi:hypothetical protein
MAKNPKPLRVDAKRNATDARKNNGEIFTSRMSGNPSPFSHSGADKIGYMSDYLVRNTGKPSRTREFMLARNRSTVAEHHQMLDEMQADHLQGKADKTDWAKKA